MRINPITLQVLKIDFPKNNFFFGALDFVKVNLCNHELSVVVVIIVIIIIVVCKQLLTTAFEIETLNFVENLHNNSIEGPSNIFVTIFCSS